MIGAGCSSIKRRQGSAGLGELQIGKNPKGRTRLAQIGSRISFESEGAARRLQAPEQNERPSNMKVSPAETETGATGECVARVASSRSSAARTWSRLFSHAPDDGASFREAPIRAEPINGTSANNGPAGRDDAGPSE